MSLLLEVNERGEWRTVAEFDPERWPEVQDAAASLKRAVGNLQLRMVDEKGAAHYLSERGVFTRTVALPIQSESEPL